MARKPRPRNIDAANPDTTSAENPYGKNRDSELTEDDLDRRFEYHDRATTGILYDFGRMLLDREVDLVANLDRKAQAMAGYAGVYMALLASTYSSWRGLGRWPILAIVTSVLPAALSGVMAVKSMMLRTVEGISPNEWLSRCLLNEPERLRRYHIKCMHGLIESYHAAQLKKAADLRAAQGSMLVAGLCLALAFLLFGLGFRAFVIDMVRSWSAWR